MYIRSSSCRIQINLLQKYVKALSSHKNTISIRSLSSQRKVQNYKNDNDDEKSKLIYQSKFGGRIRYLRRLSFLSSVVSLGFLCGVVGGFSSQSALNITAQYAIVGGCCFGGLSATLLLKLVTEPYICELYELTTNLNKNENKDRRFKAIAVNIFGSYINEEFLLNDVKETIHPFGSFKVNDRSFYLFGGGIKDDKTLKIALSKKADL